MKNCDKYKKRYFLPPDMTYDWVKKEAIEQAPVWCSVDLRDGNQALVEPMDLEAKLEYFQLLVDIGFKEIEVGFPAASETEYRFVRTLIEKHMIPDDVTVQVLTQAREHIIRKTFEAVKGAPRAVIHLYNATSVAQREQVFKMDQAHIKQLAVEGAKMVMQLAKETEGEFVFQYSPESFPGTEIEYAVEVCNAVLDVWQPTKEHKAIINIPSTIEYAMPHVYASQVEYVHKNLNYRDGVVLSVHTHNDRGCGVACSELGILAGAERLEGTLFGNGERTGNADIVTIAMNLYSHGVDPKLDFSNIPVIREVYERLTKMTVHDRSPYAGNLVFSAFSGSHQDAIAKGMEWRNKKALYQWNVPYLLIDPKDVGRTYDKNIIRINSQSGKGGVSYILKQNYGISLPANMKEEVGYLVKDTSDKMHKELTPEWIYHIFEENYVVNKGVFSVSDCDFEREEEGFKATATLVHANESRVITASGNGRLDAVSNAIKHYFGISYELSFYEEHSLTQGSSSKACAYVGVTCNGVTYWGVGIDKDIIHASVEALAIAVNKIAEIKNAEECKDERLIEILNYIQSNYLDISLDDLSATFYLSKPYLSKYIKEKSGMTFGETVKRVRMKKARTLLKGTNMTVESISLAVGYQNVEHFNRLFKKAYNMTPVQFRNSK